MRAGVEEPGKPDGPTRNPLLGIGMKVGSVAIFMVMATLIKAAGQLPAGQIVFYRSLFAIVPVLVFLAWRRELRSAMKTERPVSHIVRGFIGVISMFLGFFALTRLPLPEATTLNYAQPLLVVVFSAIFLGETVRAYRWSAVAIGLVGVVIIAWPRLTLFAGDQPMNADETVGVIAQLTGAAISAVAMLLVRRLVMTEKSSTIVMWHSLTAAAFGLATLWLGWAGLSVEQTVLLVCAGLCAGIAQVMMTESYRHADMSTVAPFEYTSMIFAIIAGYLVFSDLPTIHMLVGGTIVVGAGVFIIWREHRLGLPRGAARKVTPPH